MTYLAILATLESALVSSAAVIRVVTQCFSPTNGVSGEDRCVTTLITAVKEIKSALV